MDLHTLHALTAAQAMPRSDLRVLSFLGALGPLTAHRLAEAIGTGQPYLAIRLLRLFEAGLVVKCQVSSRPEVALVRAGWRLAPDVDVALEAMAGEYDTTVVDAMVAR